MQQVEPELGGDHLGGERLAGPARPGEQRRRAQPAAVAVGETPFVEDRRAVPHRRDQRAQLGELGRRQHQVVPAGGAARRDAPARRSGRGPAPGRRPTARTARATVSAAAASRSATGRSKTVAAEIVSSSLLPRGEAACRGAGCRQAVSTPARSAAPSRGTATGTTRAPARDVRSPPGERTRTAVGASSAATARIIHGGTSSDASSAHATAAQHGLALHQPQRALPFRRRRRQVRAGDHEQRPTERRRRRPRPPARRFAGCGPCSSTPGRTPRPSPPARRRPRGTAPPPGAARPGGHRGHAPGRGGRRRPGGAAPARRPRADCGTAWSGRAAAPAASGAAAAAGVSALQCASGRIRSARPNVGREGRPRTSGQLTGHLADQLRGRRRAAAPTARTAEPEPLRDVIERRRAVVAVPGRGQRLESGTGVLTPEPAAQHVELGQQGGRDRRWRGRDGRRRGWRGAHGRVSAGRRRSRRPAGQAVHAVRLDLVRSQVPGDSPRGTRPGRTAQLLAAAPSEMTPGGSGRSSSRDSWHSTRCRLERRREAERHRRGGDRDSRNSGRSSSGTEFKVAVHRDGGDPVGPAGPRRRTLTAWSPAGPCR